MKVKDYWMFEKALSDLGEKMLSRGISEKDVQETLLEVAANFTVTPLQQDGEIVGNG